MPSTLTHAYMATDIYNRLNNDLKFKLKNYIDDYITYSQGPDIFFFYKIFLPFGKYLKIQNFGNKVHREKVNELFIALTNNVKQTKDINKFVFLCGLLTHYIGDTICHPYVNYKNKLINNNLKRKKDYHFIIELYIDNYIVLKKGNNYKKFKCYKFAFNAKKNKNIENMLNNLFYKIYKEKNMGTIYYKSIKDMKYFFYFLRYDPYKIKRYIYNVLYLFAWYVKRDFRFLSYNFNLTEENNNKYLNLEHKEWINKKNKDNKSFLELYNEVVNKGVLKIEELYNYIYNNKDIDLENFFGNLSYVNGLPLNK